MKQQKRTTTTRITETPADLYWAGYDAYCNRLPLEYCHSDEERRGWNAANSAEAAAITGYDKFMGW